MNTELETIEKNYTIKISFLDEQNNEVTSVKTSTEFVRDMYAMHGNFALRELYNATVKYLKERGSPDYIQYESMMEPLDVLQAPPKERFRKNSVDDNKPKIKSVPLTKEEIKQLFPAAYEQYYSNH